MGSAQRNPSSFVQATVGLASLYPPYDATIRVMPALVAGIHVFMVCVKSKTWMAGTSPAMTVGGARRHVH
jgi:hypothetical protein